MRLLVKTLLFTISFCSINFLNAQVSFSAQTNLLNPSLGGVEDCAVDMNGDFLDDVVRVNNQGITIDYQQADGSFTQAVFNFNVQTTPDWSMCAGDFDNNGWNDLLLGSGSRVSFVYANDNGTEYTEVQHPEYIFSQRSTIADIDNDGNLDAFVCHDVDQSHPYRNDGTGNMVEDQTLIETHDRPGNYAAIWVDYDNDWDNDLYITKCKLGSVSGDVDRTNLMYRNNGDGTYTEVGEEIGLADNAQSWATVFEDFDNDGDFDAFIVNHDFQNRFFRNDDGIFTDIIGDTGIPPGDLGAWENASGDFNNDGFVDIFSELNNAIYLNNGDMTFTGIDLPVDDGGIGDFNNDGFLDVVKGNVIWLNDGNENNWLKVNLIGTESNRNGIGARVEIYGNWGVQTREIRSGQSFSPMSTLVGHFGIGTADTIEMLVVKWPSGMINMIENPSINAAITVVEGPSNCIGDDFAIEYQGEAVFCPGETLEISAPESTNYQWSNGDTTQSIVVSEPGTYNVYVTNSDGCISFSDNLFVQVIEDESPTLSVNGETIFCEGESVMLNASEAQNYLWSNGDTTQSITVSEAGEYFVSVDGLCQEGIPSEPIAVEVLDAPEPVVEDVTIEFSGIAVFEASGDSLVWYEEEMGGDPIGTGSIFETPDLNEETTFYVENITSYGGAEQSGGKLELTGGGGLPTTGAYSYFDVWEPFTLLTVTVRVPNNAPEGIRTITLMDGNGELLEGMDIHLEQGTHVLELNWEVPVGENLTLRCLQNNLFRNNQGVQYPYAIGDVGEIHDSFYGPTYYYYFYDWKIKKQGFDCVSDRVPATVFITDTEEQALFNDLRIYPNPASDFIMVEYDLINNQNMTIRLMDILGKEIYQIQDNSNSSQNQIRVPTNELPNGVYHLNLQLEDGEISKKIVVQN